MYRRSLCIHGQRVSISMNLFRRTAILLASSSSSNGAKLTPMQEDQQLRLKEQQLRDAVFRDLCGGFAMDSNNTTNTNTSSTTSTAYGTQPPPPPPPPPPPHSASSSSTTTTTTATNTTATPSTPKNFNIIMWFMLMYATFTLVFVRPKMEQLQGVPWWATTPDLVARWMLFRLLVSYSQQRSIQKEFEALAATNPDASFPQFMDERYGSLFAGNRTSQQSVITAVAACYAIHSDTQLIQTLKDAVGKGGRNTPDQVDAIMDALRTAYPQVFGV
eukprot:PhF_6_TR40236/c1_g1_i2/m.59825